MREIAERFGLPVHEEISSFALVQGRISIVPYLFAKQKKLLPIEESESQVTVAVSDPLDIESLEELHLLLKKQIFGARTAICAPFLLSSLQTLCAMRSS